MNDIIEGVYNVIWSDILVYFCLGLGIYLTIKFRFPQFYYFKDMIRLLFDGESSAKGISSFQAFSIAVSGRVGTGNIAGVATAIAMGGPGAIFWMWLTAILGSSTAIAEATLGQMYKEVNNGEYRGGPAYYILKGLKSKTFAWAFAIVTIVSTGFFLPSIQSNSIALAVDTAFNVSPNIVAVILTVFLAIIILGGVKRIGMVAEYIVPIMAGIYILMAIVIIGLNVSKIPEVFSLIINSAFNVKSAFGGIIGIAISWGVKRGIYSNEAGQGTAPHAASAAEVTHPYKQGLVQGFSVYVDTLLVCTATALMILFTGQYNIENPEGGFLVQNIAPEIQYGPEFTQLAVAHHFPMMGKPFIAIALFFFAFTTIMAYYYIAETNVSFVLRKNKGKALYWVLRICILLSVYLGCVITAKTAWTLGDIGVGLMAWLNLIALVFLHKRVWVAQKDYNEQKRLGKNPVFDSDKYGFKHMTFWSTKDKDKPTT